MIYIKDEPTSSDSKGDMISPRVLNGNTILKVKSRNNIIPPLKHLSLYGTLYCTLCIVKTYFIVVDKLKKIGS